MTSNAPPRSEDDTEISVYDGSACTGVPCPERSITTSRTLRASGRL
jgi:hypothetical protein